MALTLSKEALTINNPVKRHILVRSQRFYCSPVIGCEAGATCSLLAQRRTLSLSRRSFLANSRSSSSPSASASACH